jgi:ATP-dependent exoDNAse (exonuclease V) beta subunit
MNEQDFVRAGGQMYRMDRVIVDGDSVMILDYKTGEEKDAYREQIDGYLQILHEIYPAKTIHAMLAYIDQKFLKPMA